MWWARLLNSIAALYGTGAVASTTAYESIQTVTVGSGGSSTITFSSIPTGYSTLEIRAIGRMSTGGYTNNGIFFQCNGDTGANYSYHGLNGDGSSIGAYGAGSVSSSYIGEMVGSTGLISAYGVMVMQVIDYANTNKNKTFKTLIGQNQNSSGTVANITLSSGAWFSTSAINSITLICPTGNWASYTQFALYGVK